MEKRNFADLVNALQAINPDTKENVETFVRNFFDVICQGLQSDNVVKIKGFGTFKVVDVSARKSVDVNTGERIEIAPHQKITFTPDATLRSMVNKPFECLQSVTIDDGVDVKSLDLKETPAEEKQPTEELPKTVDIPEQTQVDLSDSEVTEGSENTEGGRVEEVAPPAPLVVHAEPEPENAESESHESETESPEEEESPADTEEPSHRHLSKIVIIAVWVASVIAAFFAGYYIAKATNSVLPVNKTQVVKPAKPAAKSSIKVQRDTHTPKAAPQAGNVKPAAENPKPAEKAKPEMPVLRGDKYMICGLKEVHVLQRGEDITHLAKQIYGSKDCAKYIIRYSNIQDPDLIHVGTKIKLPILVEIK